jgi:hypothetical protein
MQHTECDELRPSGPMPQFVTVGISAVSPFATTDLSELLLAPLTSVSDFASEVGTSNFKSGSRGRRSREFSLPFTAVCVVEPCSTSDPGRTTGGAPAATGSTLRRRVSSSTQRYIVFETPSSTRSRSSIASRVSTSKWASCASVRVGGRVVRGRAGGA